ncbi:MAG: mono/diheme cytochrome c family protein [Desulforhopalus sp.]|jgi:mono/diheme cytochrome c family protein
MQNNRQRAIALIIVVLFVSLCSPLVTLAQDNEKGALLYLANCAKCHGREGEGFLKLYPPIRESQYLKTNVSKIPCIIRNGLKGEITVGTTTFNQIMPAIQQLTSEQIGQIIHYMQSSWDYSVTKTDVDGWLQNCTD